MKSKSYSIAQFKAGLSSIVADVARGGEIILTDHNRPVAKLIPIKRRIPPLPRCDLKDLFELPRVKLKPGAIDSATLIRRMRDEGY